MMFDRASVLEGAALDPAPGPPATIGERAGIDARVFAETNWSISVGAALSGAYDAYIDEIESTTGRRLGNPINLPNKPTDFIISRPDPRLEKFGLGPARRVARPKTRDQREAEFFQEVSGLTAKHPGLVVRSPENIRQSIARSRADLRERQAAITRRTVDPLVSITGFLATMGTAIVDPPILASMAFGAPWASGVLRGALIDAGIAAGVEIPVQTVVQLGRREFGEKPSFGEGLAAVVAAGGGGFLFSSLIRGGVRGVSGTRALLNKSRGLPAKRAEVRAAETYLARKVELEESSPFPDTPRAREEHTVRMSEAQRAVRESRTPDIPDRPAHPVRAESTTSQISGSSSQAAILIEDPASRIGRAARQEALDTLQLGERERAAIEAVSPLLDDPAALVALHKDLRAKPATTESLLAFLRRTGGLRPDSELRALGVTARTLPGLLRKEGQPLDDATLAVFEAGFFPTRTERPTIPDLLDLIGVEVGGRKVFRPGDEDLVLQQEALRALDEGLSEAGVDVRQLKASEFGPRVQEVERAIAERIRGTEAAKMARAGADAADVEERLAIMDEAGDIVEADVRTRYEGRENETILIEDEDGVRRLTVKEMFAAFERDAGDLAAFRACAGGARA